MKNIHELSIGSYVFCASNFELKTLFTKPLRYVIQAFTGGKEEHVAQIVGQGLIADSTGDGVRVKTIDEWLKDHVIGYDMNLYAYEPLQALTEGQKKKLLQFWRASEGQDYNALLAAFSVLDKLPFFRRIKIKKARGIFCSAKCAEALLKIGFKVPEFENQGFKKINPKELAFLVVNQKIYGGKTQCNF